MSDTAATPAVPHAASDPSPALRGSAMAGWLAPTTESRVDQVLVEEVVDRAWPRDVLADDQAASLQRSIAARGIIEPLLLRRRDHRGYEVVCGQRRLEAARALSLARIPAIVRNLSTREAVLVSAWSTLERRRADQAAALLVALQAAGLSVDELQVLTGRTEVSGFPPALPLVVFNMPPGAPLRMLKLPRFGAPGPAVLPPLRPADLAAALRGLRIISPAPLLS